MPFQYICEFCQSRFERRTKALMHGRPIKYCSRDCFYKGRKKAEARTCEKCGNAFEGRGANRFNARFCSWACYDSSRRNKTEKLCPGCGQTFIVKTCVAHRYTFCTVKCRTDSKGGIYRDCKTCGKQFKYRGCDINRGLNRWHCSEECRRPPVYITCRNCMKKVRKTPSDVKNGKQFCSFRCYRCFHGETLPEKHVRQALDAMNIPYIQEAKIGSYLIDFALTNVKIALEVDGEYWHRDTTKDARKDKYLVNHGWIPCRILDTDIANANDISELIKARIQLVSHIELPCLQPSLF